MTEEEQIQIAVVQHLELRAKPNVLWWHTPNGGKRHVAEAKKLKAMGTKSGVADLLLLVNGELFSLEIKTKDGRISQPQQDWHDAVRSQSCEAYIARGLDEALAALKSWGII